MRWTDRIRQVKIFLVIAAVFIAVSSLVVSHFLVRDLAREERNKMETWAVAMSSLNAASENTDLNLVLKVINENRTIPVIILDGKGKTQSFRNVAVSGNDGADSLRFLSQLGNKWKHEGRSVAIWLGDSAHTDYLQVCYGESTLLRRLSAYPFVQLGVVVLFVVVAIIALLSAKRSEQDRVWVGLSKETAHQLGTPISSLMAWNEILKESGADHDIVMEMGKDIERLQLTANRFSKIGSVPDLSPTALQEIINRALNYMSMRASHKVRMDMVMPEKDVTVPLNASLFEWVIENLVKNAIDAMGAGGGTITIRVTESGHWVFIDVSDTGKGIRKKDIPHVFTPGFTTKNRGWGLGLSLAKRIVESYHHGKIRVKNSEVGRGTTFRIELRNDLDADFKLFFLRKNVRISKLIFNFAARNNTWIM